MRKLRLIPLLALAALAVGVVAARADIPTNECNGIQNCERAQGPWVIVPQARLGAVPAQLPGPARHRGRRRGDRDVDRRARLVGREARLAGLAWPVDAAVRLLPRHLRQTTRRRVPAPHRLHPDRADAPRPTPTWSGGHGSRRAAEPRRDQPQAQARHGRQDHDRLRPVPDRRRQLDAVAFRTADAPRLGCAQAVQVKKTVQGKNVAVTIAVSEALPPAPASRCSSA